MSGAEKPRRRREAGFTRSWRSAENGFMSSRRSAENGFTLIEMLVALAIFSLAALALLRLSGATAANGARLTEQALAQIVARNLAAEVMTDPDPPALGVEQGVVDNAGRQWRWTRSVERSPEPRIQLITIRVQGEQGIGAATLSVFRSAE